MMFLRHISSFRKFSRNLSVEALEGSSNTGTNLCPPRRPGRTPQNDILTLDPNKFAEKKQRRLHIGDLQVFTPFVPLDNQSTFDKGPRMAPLRLFYDATSRTVTGMFPSFPPNTNAFLYYFTPPDKPRIAGELRLRVTSSDDPASFESGSDLLRMDGQIWSRPLCYLSKLYFHLYQKLREELLVPDDLDTALSTLLSKNPRYRRSRILYTLNDTFVADFNSSGMNFVVITEKGMAKLRTSWIFFDTREMWNCAPYTGSALVRFERSTNPDHKGTRTVVLRFLKIITPVKCVIPRYDGHICCPREGELHRKIRYNTTESEWSVNIDKPKSPGFQLLWDS